MKIITTEDVVELMNILEKMKDLELRKQELMDKYSEISKGYLKSEAEECCKAEK